MTSAEAGGAVTRSELEAKIVKRCWADETFRKELLADPVACFVKYTGQPADRAPRIRVHEEGGRDWHIVIPAKPRQTDELSDEDLERVAGGTDPFVITATIVTAASLVYTVTASAVAVTASAAVSAAVEMVVDPW